MAIAAFLIYGLVAALVVNAQTFMWSGVGIVAVAPIYLVAAPRFIARGHLT